MMDEPYSIDNQVEKVFSQTDNTRAVIFISNVLAVRKKDRGPMRRKEKKYLEKIGELDTYDEIKTFIKSINWNGPAAIWFIESREELYNRIREIEISASHRNIGLGIGDGQWTDEIAVMSLWVD